MKGLILKKNKSLNRMNKEELKNHLFYIKLVGSIQSRGRKIWAFNYFVRTMYYIKQDQDNKIDPYFYLLTAMNKLTPSTHLVYFRFGTNRHPIPFLITVKKQVFYAVKWVFKIMKNFYRNVPLDSFAALIMASFNEKGRGFEKKLETHRLAEANRHLLKLIK